uniref:Tetratricopeptide repeat domain 17 n=1 Tax=Astyanax mexicanus TaxID=7994 RepID=A0A8B9R892_ASTMX
MAARSCSGVTARTRPAGFTRHTAPVTRHTAAATTALTRHTAGLLLLCAMLTQPARATTHWVVTEDGKIQQQVDSPLNLKHPHHLVLFMQQETRVNYLKNLEKQLVAQKIHIEENEDRDTGLEQRHYKEDPDCVTAKVPLGDLDLYDGTFISLESKGINPEDYVDSVLPLPSDLEKPDCAEILELPYSIHAFQHLRGVQERANLTSPLLSKDDPIFASLSHKLGQRVDEVGHRIQQGLLRNSSSWVLYDLASFYWRMKNEPRRAVDCVVRALHFSPRQHKDVALVNMANILHRAHFSADAAILAHAALDLTTDLLTSHYTLGNIYAMLGEYNHSVLCYEQALQAQPGFEQALRRKHAVLCQQKLEQRLEAQHRSLQRTLNELKEYQKQHDHYLRQQSTLDKHKLIQEEQILRNIIHETQMAKEAQLGNHQMCHLGQQNSLFCPFDLPVRYHRGDLFENVHYIQVRLTTPTTDRGIRCVCVCVCLCVQVLLRRSGGWSLEQTGALITHAMEKMSVPRWLLQNEAGLFWRAQGNGTRALQCLRQALHSAPPQHRGIPLVNTANLLLHHGLRREAQTLLQQALELNTSEPHTVLSMVNVQLTRGNLTGALALFRHALSLSAGCSQCRASLPLLRCLQFYPFLYNLQHQPCQPGGHTHRQGAGEGGRKVVVDSNGSGEVGQQERGGEEKRAGLEGEEDWRLREELIGALDMSGKRGDLRGIRVLKNDGVMGAKSGGPCFGNCEEDDGAEWVSLIITDLRCF